MAFLTLLTFYNILCLSLCRKGPVKKFTIENCTNIVITGGVQGLGKALALEFAVRNEIGSVNLIIIDIREDLACEMMTEISKAVVNGGKKFKYVNFYKCNIAHKEEIERVWNEIVEKYGDVHILVNNAARAIGKSVESMNIDQFKLTMDINFNSYVHFTMLFMK